MSEEEVLRRLAARLGPEALVGDDTAWLGQRWINGLVATVDSHIEGVHYLAAALPLARVARRLVAVNVSDLAASGARARFGLLALAGPAGFDADAFLAATARALEAFGAVLVGGDLARSDRVVASLTLLGEPEKRGPLLARSAARPGDRLWIGGAVGESALGCALAARGATWPLEADQPLVPAHTPGELTEVARRALRRHFAPTPQVDLGLALARLERVAAIDISDGLAKDCTRLATASAVGFTLDPEAIPTAAQNTQLAAFLGLDLPEVALGGGEDYVLLAASAADLGPLGMTPIGTVDAQPGAKIRRPSGQIEDLPPSGWDHLSKPAREQ